MPNLKHPYTIPDSCFPLSCTCFLHVGNFVDLHCSLFHYSVFCASGRSKSLVSIISARFGYLPQSHIHNKINLSHGHCKQVLSVSHLIGSRSMQHHIMCKWVRFTWPYTIQFIFCFVFNCVCELVNFVFFCCRQVHSADHHTSITKPKAGVMREGIVHVYMQLIGPNNWLLSETGARTGATKPSQVWSHHIGLSVHGWNTA